MKLSDDEAHERLVKAQQLLGSEEAQTKWANTALEAGRKALALLQLGLVAASDRNKINSNES